MGNCPEQTVKFKGIVCRNKKNDSNILKMRLSEQKIVNGELELHHIVRELGRFKLKHRCIEVLNRKS